MPNIAPRSSFPIPMALSHISAGPGTDMAADCIQIDLNRLVTGDREGFGIFEVTGDSQDPEIKNGYFVFVDFWAEARNGKFVAVTINGLTCVKKFENSKRGLYLISANTDYEPRQVTQRDSFQVLGVVRGHMALYPK